MTAILSACGRYRYRLERRISALDHDPNTRGAVAFLMLNPSTADATEDDPTIRRCIGYARAWGFRFMFVGNVYALRSTDPAALWKAVDPVGPDNDHHLAAIAGDAELVVCAWGKHAKPDRVRAVLALIAAAGCTPHALKLNKDRSPAHPLYLRADLVPQPWSPT